LGDTRRFLESLDGDELRQLLRARRLKSNGNVQKLSERLARHVATTASHDGSLKFMIVGELRVLLRSRGLRVSGLKQELCERLVRHAAA
jgi:hypothetical protein